MFLLLILILGTETYIWSRRINNRYRNIFALITIFFYVIFYIDLCFFKLFSLYLIFLFLSFSLKQLFYPFYKNIFMLAYTILYILSKCKFKPSNISRHLICELCIKQCWRSCPFLPAPSSWEAFL